MNRVLGMASSSQSKPAAVPDDAEDSDLKEAQKVYRFGLPVADS